MLLHIISVDFFERHTCFFHLDEWAYLEQNEPFSTVKTMVFRKYSFQKLTQYSQGMNILDAPAYNIGGFL
jgi:hypothetical protein